MGNSYGKEQREGGIVGEKVGLTTVGQETGQK